MSLDRGLPTYQTASKSIQPFGHNGHGSKIGERVVPPFFFLGGEFGARLTQCGRGRGLPPCQVHLDPSSRLATMQQRHRQHRQDRGEDRQRSDGIGQTVLETVAQKLKFLMPDRVNRAIMHHRAEFYDDWSNRCQDIVISWFFCRMVVVRHLASYLTLTGTTHIQSSIVFIVAQN